MRTGTAFSANSVAGVEFGPWDNIARFSKSGSNCLNNLSELK